MINPSPSCFQREKAEPNVFNALDISTVLGYPEEFFSCTIIKLLLDMLIGAAAGTLTNDGKDERNLA